jgi:hypothetical protein
MRKQLTDDQMYRRVRLNTIAIMGFFALLGLMTERIWLTVAAVVAAIALSSGNERCGIERSSVARWRSVERARPPRSPHARRGSGFTSSPAPDATG